MKRVSDESHSANCFPRVERLRKLLGDDVLMLPWPKRTKGTTRKWGHLSAAKMAEPAYLARLEEGNIGIAQGAVSGGLCSIDLDDDTRMEEFLVLNPALHGSLRTRGARGCNVWVRVLGEYPASAKITLPDKKTKVGELRANGNQTIISGTHKDTGQEYTFLVEARPVHIAFDQIVWPSHFTSTAIRGSSPSTNSLSAEHDLHAEQAQQASQAQQVFQAEQVGSESTASFSTSSFFPTERGQSDRLLWDMTGALKSWESKCGRQTTPTERTDIFNDWWKQAEPHVDPEMGYDLFLAKWLANCNRRKFSDDPLASAWAAALTEPLPPEATAPRDVPLTPALQRLVALCWQLQRFHGDGPFFLGQLDTARLLGVSPRTAHLALDALSRPDGRLRILRKVTTGTLAGHKASEWLYIRQGTGT